LHYVRGCPRVGLSVGVPDGCVWVPLLHQPQGMSDD